MANVITIKNNDGSMESVFIKNGSPWNILITKFKNIKEVQKIFKVGNNRALSYPPDKYGSWGETSQKQLNEIGWVESLNSYYINCDFAYLWDVKYDEWVKFKINKDGKGKTSLEKIEIVSRHINY